MAGQVQDAPGVLVQAVHDGIGLLVDAVLDLEPVVAQQLRDQVRLVARPG